MSGHLASKLASVSLRSLRDDSVDSQRPHSQADAQVDGGSPGRARYDAGDGAVVGGRRGDPGLCRRVTVFGAVVPDGGTVTGADVHAWVEVRVGDGSWRTLPTTAFMDRDKPAALPPQSQQQLTGNVVPPPQPIPPPSTVGDQSDTDLRTQRSHKTTPTPQPAVHAGAAWIVQVATYVGTPTLLVAGIVGAIVGAKVVRRRRRRTAATVSARFVGGWRELVDHARDLGVAVPGGAVTRREQALAFAGQGAPGLARTADRHVFGPTAPAADAATSYWRDVDAERRSMSREVGRWRRLLAALSLRTFRRP